MNEWRSDDWPVLTNWMQSFEEAGLTAEEQDQIFWGTAAYIFGVED